MKELKKLVNKYAALRDNCSDEVMDIRLELSGKIVDLLIAILGIDRHTACRMMFTKFEDVYAIVNRY